MIRRGRPRRVRRSAADAREQILEAAAARLIAEGPARLRLQEVAADVGVSHPTILHHFGSREALVREVLTREMTRMENDLVTAVLSESFDEGPPIGALRRAMDAFVASGSARLVAFLALEGDKDREASPDPHLRRLAEVIHARRIERHGPAPFEDTLHVVLSVALAVVADALFGEGPWRAMGIDAAGRRRFQDWLLARASERIEGASTSQSRSPNQPVEPVDGPRPVPPKPRSSVKRGAARSEAPPKPASLRERARTSKRRRS